MLTVKHIYSTGESVRQAIEVRSAHEPISANQPCSNGDTHRQVVYADLEGNSTAQFDGGTVFVMNDNGATVAKYELGGWPKPSA